MSLSHSPKVATDGLVFYYDMGNTQKSWKGAPTTNLLPSPETISTTWTKEGGFGTVTANYRVAPDGTVTTTRCQYSSGYLYYTLTLTPGITYTFSCYIRGAPQAGRGIGLWSYAVGGIVAASTQTIGISYWTRVSVTYTVAAGASSFAIMLAGAPSNIFQGDIEVWHPQLEVGSFATPYINGTRYANSNLETTPIPTWNQSAATASGGTLTFTSGSYNSKGTWDLYKQYTGLSTATNYTWSALVKLGTASNLLVTMNNTQSWSTGPSVQITLDQLSTSEYRRISITGTTNTGSINLHLGASNNTELVSTVQSAGTIFIQDVRLELTTARSALADLTGNNSIAATSLTYSSDGTFSFNGSSNYLTSNNILNGNSAATICAWVQKSNTGYHIALGTSIDVATNPRMELIWYTNGYLYGEVGPDHNTWVNAIPSQHDTNWHHIAMVYNGAGSANYDRITLFFDGVQLVPNSSAGTIPSSISSTGNLLVGTRNGSYSYGKIPTVQIYDRSLSATEIRQNFNATRGRYGI